MRLAGCGLSIADILYHHVDFSSAAFRAYQSLQAGDGGLEPGKVNFPRDLESFAHEPFDSVIRHLLGDQEPDGFNVGGPAIVALILAAQLLPASRYSVEFCGALGQDGIGARFLDLVRQTPLQIPHLRQLAGSSPHAYVLSDPNYDHGHGERLFISQLGSYWDYSPDDLPGDFFTADLVLFGSTALTPKLHRQLTSMLEEARSNGAICVVGTVFDLLSERKHPGRRWSLGQSDRSYQLIDLLIMDKAEALGLSGCARLEDSIPFFIASGVSSFVITNGPRPVCYYSDGRLSQATAPSHLPVSAEVGRRLSSPAYPQGDTTGCGDNFCGGVLASLAEQLAHEPRGRLNLAQAVARGICAGGAACFQLGGIHIEQHAGDKRALIDELYEAYLKQIHGLPTCDPNALLVP